MISGRNHLARVGSLLKLGITFAILLESSELLAAGKKPPAVPLIDGLKVIALAQVDNIQIEMPDHTFHNFGEDFQASLTTQLMQSGKYIVADSVSSIKKRQMEQSSSAPSDYRWEGSVTPAATVTVQVDALNFSTGLRGDHLFYGFDERFRTPFNDGSGLYPNEFPLRLFFPNEPSWFGNSFEQKGVFPFDSRSGLDLGDGFDLDFLVAWLTVKYASYHSELHLTLTLDVPGAAAPIQRKVEVKGDGFFFDVAGGYDQYSGAISVARNDAMGQALKKSLDGSFGALDRSLAGLPLMAKVDAVLPNGVILLGTGLESGVRSGVLYEVMNHPQIVIEVSSSVLSGSIGHVSSGDLSQVQAGQVLRQVLSLPAPVVVPNAGGLIGGSGGLGSGSGIPQIPSNSGIPEIPSGAGSGIPVGPSALDPSALDSQISNSLGSSGSGGLVQHSLNSSSVSSASSPLAVLDSTQLPNLNLPQTNLSGWVQEISRWEAFWKSVVEGIFLPYRIWRYFAYDQAYHKEADLGGSSLLDLSHEAWSSHVGLANLPQMVEGSFGGQDPIVAVIDSGVDYNHPAIHDSLWLNPNPWQDPNGRKDRYGWDFISEDSRPYDDGYHGTQVASVVLGVAPKAKIMPLKIFNPWGITNASSIYGAFTYAVDHGSQVIVCAWASSVYSKAFEMGISYAKDHGVVVVTAAGDFGMSLTFAPSYPAILSPAYDNVITVTGVDEADHLNNSLGRSANYDPETVNLAAPGSNVPVAEPRSGNSRETSTGLAAAMVAGGLARYAVAGETYQQWIESLLHDADAIGSLESSVKGGLRLHLKK